VIGVLCTSYPRGPDDPAGSFVRSRVRELVAAGHEVEVIAAGEMGMKEDGPVRVLRIPGAGTAEIFYAGGAPEALESGSPEGRATAWLEAAHFTARLMALVAERAAEWSAVESHWLLPSALVACAAAPNLVHRAHAHGGDVFLLTRLPGGASLARFICRSRAELVFVSADLEQRFARLCGQPPLVLGAKTQVRPAPFDSRLFRPYPPDEIAGLRGRLEIGGFTVLGAGRLVPIKGFDVLILAIGRLPLPIRPVLVLAGTGPEEQRLRRLAATCSVELRLLGEVAPSVLADWMAATDLFVHPCRSLPNGRREGAPVAVREALAVGQRVIASRTGGLPELSVHQTLTLVPPDNATALAAAITLTL
jgi:glycosyltransferase involved in cell wall biosynthesis